MTIFSGYFVVDHTLIIECYENGNQNNILAPIGSYGGNNNMFGSVADPFNDNGVNLTTMSYYAGNYGENSSDKTYNLYSFSDKNGFIANFNGVYHFTISTGSVPQPVPQPTQPEQPAPIQPVRSGMYYKLRMEITLDDSTVFSGFFVINNHVHPNIIGFYEDGNPKNILASPGSNGNDNVFRSLTHPFSEKGVTIKTMSYYTIADRNDPLPNDNGTYTLSSFNNHNGFISGITYRYTISLDNGPIPLHPIEPIEPIAQPIALMASTALTTAPTTALTAPIAPYQPYQKSRFCYNYKPPGIIEPCCKPVVCATNEYLASLASIPAVVNNSTRTIESSLLQASVKRQQQEIQTQTINRTVQATIANAAAINSTIYSQLINIRNERYAPYQPYVYPVVPPSVIELQMRTANVGVPHTFNTIANCKGNQFVTT
jgi:hypothetical protein